MAEWIEFAVLFGADKIQMYELHMPEVVRALLREYEERGVLDLRQVNIYFDKYFGYIRTVFYGFTM